MDFPTINIPELNDEELASLACALEADRITLKEAQRAVGLEQERRALEAAAAAKIADMSDKEKDELRKALGV